mmetsp:Transcript_26561/g.81679  ORF Transcript_26561/g.81679 Transcript_26561/m.81679 type:complete len:217 (+) Transcript_26561:485-1135(+)
MGGRAALNAIAPTPQRPSSAYRSAARLARRRTTRISPLPRSSRRRSFQRLPPPRLILSVLVCRTRDSAGASSASIDSSIAARDRFHARRPRRARPIRANARRRRTTFERRKPRPRAKKCSARTRPQETAAHSAAAVAFEGGRAAIRPLQATSERKQWERNQAHRPRHRRSRSPRSATKQPSSSAVSVAMRTRWRRASRTARSTERSSASSCSSSWC